MRDNHDGLLEILDAFEKAGQYFGVVKVEIGGQSKKFSFGVSQAGYRALKKVLQLHPFDSLPGLKHRYFFARAYRSDSEHGMQVRVEQGKDGKQVDALGPQDLLANLRWFSELRDFSEAAHLAEVPLSNLPKSNKALQLTAR